MSDPDGANGGSNGDRDGDTKYGDISAEKAYNVYNNNDDISYRDIALESSVSKDTVRRRIKDFEGGLAMGKESVKPDDFTLDRLGEAIEDKEPDNEIYNTYDCPVDSCTGEVQENDKHCSKCGTELDWEE